MSERDFQAAILHVYRTAEIPASVLLTNSERSWLEELIASQRDRLDFIANRLRAKRHRLIWHALPNSRAAFPDMFDAWLRDWSDSASLESGADHPGAMRDFARHTAASRHKGRASAYVHFEAACAAVALSDFRRTLPDSLSPLLQLGLESDADLIRCDYDLQALQDPVTLAAAEPLPTPGYALLFLDRSGAVRSLDVSPSLATVLAQFRGGARLQQILAHLPSSAARDALSQVLAQLQRLGVPFFLPSPP